MKIIPSESPSLYRVVDHFDFENPPTDPIQLANDLIDFMRKDKAVGLAANQLGLPYRVFVMEGEPAFVCFNPKIVDTSPEDSDLVEGCLTFPDLWLKIKRPSWVRVRFQDPYGNVVTKMFGGYHGRVFQHELEHLEGKVFTRLVHSSKLKKAIKNRDILKKSPNKSKNEQT